MENNNIMIEENINTVDNKHDKPKKVNHVFRLLEIIALFLIVFDYYRFEGDFGNIVSSMSKIAYPLFFISCGYNLFNDETSKEELRSRLFKKTKKIFIVFVLSALVYFLVEIVQNKKYIEQFMQATFVIPNTVQLICINKPFFSDHNFVFITLLVSYLVIAICPHIFKNKNSLLIPLISILPVALIINLIAVIFHLHIGPIGLSVNSIYRAFYLEALPLISLGLLLRKYSDKLINSNTKLLIIFALIAYIASIFENICSIAIFKYSFEYYIGSILSSVLFVIIAAKFSDKLNCRLLELKGKPDIYFYIYFPMIATFTNYIYGITNLNSNAFIYYTYPLAVVIFTLLFTLVYNFIMCKISRFINGENGAAKLIKNILFNNIYQILILIVPLITTPYVSRVLTPEGVGIYSYTNSIVTYFTIFAALGTVSYGTREIARNRDNKEELSKTFWEIELITVITSLLSLGVWMIVCVNYHEYNAYMWLWSMSIIAMIFDISWLYAGLEKFKYSISINAFFKIIACIMIFVYVKSIEDTWKYVMINSMAMMLGNLSMWIFLPKTVKIVKIEKSKLWLHFKETLIYFVPAIATSIYTVLDKTLIGAITKNHDYNGQYESATKIIGLCKVIGFSAIADVVCSRSSYLFKIADKDRINKLTHNTYNIVLTFSVAMSFGISAIADRFVPLFFGDGYEMTISLIYVLSPVIFIISLSSVAGSLYYIPSGKRGLSAWFLIAGSAVNLVMNIILINLIGPKGACIATIIAETIISSLYITFCKIFTWKDLIEVLWRKVIAGLVMFVVVYFFKKLDISNAYLDIGARIIIGAIVYFSVLLVLRDGIFKSLIERIKTKKEINSVR